MAPLITGVFERLWHRMGLSGTANTASESLHQLTHSHPWWLHLTGSAWVAALLSIGGDVNLLTPTTEEVELAPVWWQRFWESVSERMLMGTKTGGLLYATEGKKHHIWEVLGGRPVKRKEHSRESMSNLTAGSWRSCGWAVAGHSTKCSPLIKVWELRQTSRHSYLPIQQLFDSSVREAARLLWQAAWLSLPKVAFRERDKLPLS